MSTTERNTKLRLGVLITAAIGLAFFAEYLAAKADPRSL